MKKIINHCTVFLLLVSLVSFTAVAKPQMTDADSGASLSTENGGTTTNTTMNGMIIPDGAMPAGGPGNMAPAAVYKTNAAKVIESVKYATVM